MDATYNYTQQTSAVLPTNNQDAGRVRLEQTILEQLTHGLNDKLGLLRGRLESVLLPLPPVGESAQSTNQPEPNRSSVAQQTHFIAGLISDACANIDDLLRRLDV